MMGFLMPFIVLIERRLLRPVMLALLSSLLLIVGLGAQAGASGKPRKVALDLEEAVASPLEPGHRWVKHQGGQRLVEALIVSDAADPEMKNLRDHVQRLGGTVGASFTSVQALMVTVPTKALKELDERSDVVSISPNRTARHSVSNREATTGAATAAVRTATGSTTYTGLDGSGIGIAVLDSGVMASHLHLANAAGISRVLRQVSLVGQGANPGSAMAPGSAARISYENTLNTNAAVMPDPYGHGSHVAAIAAGRGTDRTTYDTTGVAPGASIIDVRVLGADGSGTTADVIAGLDWVLYNARQYNIRVVNLSLSAGSTSSWVNDPLAQAARAVVASGIVVVTASGNYGQIGGATTFGTVGSPGHDPSVITVGSSNMKLTTGRSDDVVNGFSSRGPTRGAVTSSTGVRAVDNLLKPDLVAAGTLSAGLAINATALPTPTSTVAGGTFNWSRIVTMGGRHIATGDALFTQFQPIYDPRVNWVGASARRVGLSYWPYNAAYPHASTVPNGVTEPLSASGNLLTPGVRLGRALAGASSAVGKTGVFLPSATMSSWLISGSGQVLASGVVLRNGVVLSESVSGQRRASAAATPAAEC